MEPLVTLWPRWGLIGSCVVVWKAGLLMLGSCAVSVVTLLILRTQVCTSLSVTVVPALLIMLYSFIFHCFAVSSSTSPITLLDSVQLTAAWEPKLWADVLLFWPESFERAALMRTHLGVSFGPTWVLGEKPWQSSSSPQTHIHLFYMATAREEEERLM